ncbi:WD40/YVTN/BNR-like repeat-containing protein [Brevundimonas intermedia]|uniref:WD40/YVTN/BNR-like repeat-containing protein n=1 Tax=Brevundimonas intermedia TaxID=74315 RepID=UPI0022F28040|nr:hypothetical protein [Brevundimonas intermedia]
MTADNTNGASGVQGGFVGVGTMLRPVVPAAGTIAGAFNGIASNAAVAVAVGSGGLISSSTDGETWTPRTSGVASALNSVAWVAALNLFVAVGAAGTIVTSPDGVTWTVQTSGSANALNSVIVSASTLVAVGAAGTILTSADGVTWATNAYSSANALNQVAHNGAGLVCAVDSQGQAVTASNPAGVWTAAPVTPVLTTRQPLVGLAYGAGLWVAVAGQNGRCYTSSDAVTWTDRGPRFQRVSQLNYVAGSIPSDVEGGMTGMFIHNRDYSFDGLTWYRIAHSGPGACASATIFKGVLYAATGVSGWFLTKMSRIVTRFTPMHVMGTLGGQGGSTSAAVGGGSDGSGTVPGTIGGASAISGSASPTANAAAAGGGGAGGGATAANASIGASLGAEGSIAPQYTLQGFQGVSGGVGPLDGGPSGTDPTSLGGSGAGGGAWTSGAAGQAGGKGGNPGGGGGGGGASDNGFDSGGGGAGGDGQARLFWF